MLTFKGGIFFIYSLFARYNAKKCAHEIKDRIILLHALIFSYLKNKTKAN